jgi:spore maturation protein CgeB
MAIAVSDSITSNIVARANENCVITGSSKDAWVQAISALIENPAARVKYATAARENIRKNHTFDHTSQLILHSMMLIQAPRINRCD